MASLFRDRITLVWLALMLATCLSWETGTDLLPIRNMATLGTIVLVIAFVKVRYIMLEFMELRHAPLAMRLIVECWSVVVCAAVILFYSGIGISFLSAASQSG
jgi:hypothetical protein